jgi:AhpC/TSA family
MCLYARFWSASRKQAIRGTTCRRLWITGEKAARVVARWAGGRGRDCEFAVAIRAPVCASRWVERLYWKAEGFTRMKTLCALLFSAVLMAQAPKTHLKIGDAAPDFTLQASTGKPVSLHDYKGKTVVVAFFPAAFTGG